MLPRSVFGCITRWMARKVRCVKRSNHNTECCVLRIALRRSRRKNRPCRFQPPLLPRFSQWQALRHFPRGCRTRPSGRAASRRRLLKLGAAGLSGAVAASWFNAASLLAADSALDTLDSVRGRIRLGAEIFLDPSHTREEIQMHFRRMKEVGLSLARVFIIWDHVERKRGQWTFDLYDAAYDAAAANGIPMLTTLCPEDPPGWTRQAPFYHSKLIINTPEFRQHAGEYLRRVVERYKDHPGPRPVVAGQRAGPARIVRRATMRRVRCLAEGPLRLGGTPQPALVPALR